jgi:hypothetical protein
MLHFSGFGADQAEWINARTSLRQRSLPCNTMECVAVKPRDIVFVIRYWDLEHLLAPCFAFNTQTQRERERDRERDTTHTHTHTLSLFLFSCIVLQFYPLHL